MSDPRMIPADDARVTLDAANQASGYGYSFPDAYVRDLAHTVIEQAAQIERVRKAVSRIEKKLENGTTEWRDGLKADQHLEGYTDGLDIALAEIEQALGDADG